MLDPSISVVIPVYNQLESLKIVLRFFNYQSYPKDRYEVIVIDDGSEENVEQCLDQESYDFALNIYSQVNSGRARARNRGVALAGGELIIFCDADRIPDLNFISKHAQFHHFHINNAVFGRCWDCFLSKKVLTSCSEKHISAIRRFSRDPEYYRKISKLFLHEKTSSKIAWAAFLVGNSSIKKLDFINAGGFDEEFKYWGFEHFELALRLQQDNIEICHNRMASSYHLPHSRDKDQLRRDIKQSKEVLLKKYPYYRVDLLESFLFGSISLQEFEFEFSHENSEGIVARDPIFFNQLA